MREVIMTGKTVEEATALALAELGLTEEETTVEILDLPQKKLFKTIPAKVRVTADMDDMEEELAPVVEEVAARNAEPTASVAEQTTAMAGEQLPLDENPKIAAAVAYLLEVAAKMGAANITVTPYHNAENDSIVLKVEGDDAGALIGHRGEVMEALNYLTGLVANRAGGDYTKLSLDVNSYRAKRETNLTALATRIAQKVAKTGRSQMLEPMNPYERRIIHSAVSEVEGVKSESTGEGINRRVVISSTAPNAQRGNGNRGGNRGGNRNNNRTGGGANRGGNSRGPRREGGFDRKPSVPGRDFADKPRTDAAPIVPKRTETINDGADLPLYGKIEL